jgi:hypothetical protein
MQGNANIKCVLAEVCFEFASGSYLPDLMFNASAPRNGQGA